MSGPVTARPGGLRTFRCPACGGTILSTADPTVPRTWPKCGKQGRVVYPPGTHPVMTAVLVVAPRALVERNA